ncbi:unnamed protein product, partial [Prorocentrum cordatum]
MLVDLVEFKGGQIHEGIAHLLDEEPLVEARAARGGRQGGQTPRAGRGPLEEVLRAPKLNDGGADSPGELFAEAVSSAPEWRAEFHWRVAQPCYQQCPFPNVLPDCLASRRPAPWGGGGRLARELLADAGIVDDATSGFRAAFVAEVGQAATGGALCIRSWTLLPDAASVLGMSVRGVEGRSSILMWVGSAAPGVELELASSRLALNNKKLGIIGGGQSAGPARRDAEETRGQLIVDIAGGRAAAEAFCASLRGAPKGAADADSYCAALQELATPRSQAVEEALAVGGGRVDAGRHSYSGDGAFAIAGAGPEGAGNGGREVDPQSGAADVAADGEGDWGDGGDDDNGRDLRLFSGEVTDQRSGASSIHALTVNRKYGEGGDDVKEWFLIGSKVGRSMLWAAPLCQNLDAVSPSGLGVVRLQRPIAHRKIHLVVGHLIQQAGSRGIGIPLSFQTAKLKWESAFQAPVAVYAPLQRAEQRGRLKRADAEAEAASMAKARRAGGDEADEGGDCDQEGDGEDAEGDTENAEITKHLVAMGPSESQGLEAECGGRGASIDEVVGAAKVRVEMGGAKPRATTPAGDIASLGLAWRPTAKTVATAAETRGSVSR